MLPEGTYRGKKSEDTLLLSGLAEVLDALNIEWLCFNSLKTWWAEAEIMARVLSPAKFDSLHRKTSAEVIQTNMNFCNKNASPISLLMGCILGRFQKGQSSKAACSWNRVVFGNGVEAQFEFSSCCSILTMIWQPGKSLVKMLHVIFLVED